MTEIITQSTIYLGKNLFGSLSSCTAPDIESVSVDIKNGYGTYSLPVGVNALTSTINLLSFDEDVLSKIGNPFKSINATIYASGDKFTNEDLKSSDQIKLVLRGSAKKFGLLGGELKRQETSDNVIELNVSAAKLYINNKEKYHIDVPNLIWKVDGVDLLATIRKNLALI